MKSKKQELFELLHSKGDDFKGNGFHSYLVDDEYSIRYRCDCGKMGSFEVAKLDESEEFNVSLDDWEVKEETWYLYDGNYSDELPELEIGLALKFVKRNKN